jgi:hypothetical protein
MSRSSRGIFIPNEKLFGDTGLQYEIHVLAEVAANGSMLALESDMTTACENTTGQLLAFHVANLINK